MALAYAERLGLRRPSAAFARARRSRIHKTPRPPGKRQRTGALQDAGAKGDGPRLRGASWTAAALRRFRPREALTHPQNASSARKAPEGWTHSKTLARQATALAYAKRLGLRRASAAFVRAGHSRNHETPRSLEKRPRVGRMDALRTPPCVCMNHALCIPTNTLTLQPHTYGAGKSRTR
jgi:hypothetical protein